jgi:hypothetical protein
MLRKQRRDCIQLGTIQMECLAKLLGQFPNVSVIILTKTMTFYKAAKKRSNASLQGANVSISTTSPSTDHKILNVAASTPTRITMLPKRHVLVVHAKILLQAGRAPVDTNSEITKQSVSTVRRKSRRARP